MDLWDIQRVNGYVAASTFSPYHETLLIPNPQASEQFLERLVKQYPEWPVCVHRPSLISRDDIPQLDLAHNFLKYSRLLGAVPSSHGRARGVMNVVQLNTRVKGILDCALPEYVSEHEKGKVHFVNHIGKLDLPFNDMRKWALDRNEDGYVDFAEIDLKEIPADDWARRAGDLGMHPTIVAFLTSFATVGEVEFPIVTKDAME
jgi:hybrid polyketide synthase/nonribosomal peptide synthetase ACE1